jgi:hypothetical protein
MALSPLAVALMQAQTQQPPARPGQISPTDTLGAYQLAGNMAEQQYQAQLNQQNALWGGLASVGGAGITGASRIPAIQQAIGKWISPSAAPTAQDLADDAAADAADANIPGAYGPAADLASSAPNLGGWMSDPAFACYCRAVWAVRRLQIGACRRLDCLLVQTLLLVAVSLSRIFSRSCSHNGSAQCLRTNPIHYPAKLR